MSDNIEAREALVGLIRDAYYSARDHGGTMDSAGRDAADAILAAGWRPPARVIETEDERWALPFGTVVRSNTGTIACRYDERRGRVFGDERPFSWGILDLPLTVLHEGGV